MFTFKRNLADLVLVCSNDKYDFYLHRVGQTHARPIWYTEALFRGTDEGSMMAGFRTKRAAVEAAHAWKEWAV